MPKKKTPTKKKTSKKKKKAVLPDPPAHLAPPQTGKALPREYLVTDPEKIKILEEIVKEDPEAKRREKVMEVRKKLFEDAVAQAREFLDTELNAALEGMKQRMETDDRELELLCAQESGYIAYVLVASVARTVNRVRPDIRCEDLLKLVTELPR